VAALAAGAMCAAMALGAAAGCGGIDYAEDTYACTPGEPGTCPPGMVCRWSAAGGENRCFGGAAGDGSVGPDGDAGQPEITGVEGTGLAQAVAPRPADQAAFDNAANKVVAGQRIDSTTPELVIAGTGLSGATAVSAAGQGGQGTIDFEIQAGGTDTMLRVRFPQVLAVAAGGLFLLTVTTPAGEASAQVFFLQGQDGQCSNTVTGDLTVNGDIVASGQISAGEPADCPSGYAKDPAVDPSITVCVDAANGDEMVRVGDFWIDRYEASIWSDAGCSVTQYGATTDNYPDPAFGECQGSCRPICDHAVAASASSSWLAAGSGVRHYLIGLHLRNTRGLLGRLLVFLAFQRDHLSATSFRPLLVKVYSDVGKPRPPRGATCGLWPAGGKEPDTAIAMSGLIRGGYASPHSELRPRHLH
jgi:hypothetical protein